MASTPQFNQRFQQKRNNPRRVGLRVPAPTFPVAPIEGDLFWETDTDTLWVWDGTAWREVATFPTSTAGPPLCTVTNVGNQSIPNNTLTAVLFDTELVDTDNFHSTVSNTNRLVAPVDGRYDVQGGVVWNSGITGVREMWIGTADTAGLTLEAQQNAPTAGAAGQNISLINHPMNTGDFVSLVVRHTQGVALDILDTSQSPRFSIRWVAPL